MSDNWVVQHLINTLDTWNEKLAEVWQLLTISPENFKGGGIWKVIRTRIIPTLYCFMGKPPILTATVQQSHGQRSSARA